MAPEKIGLIGGHTVLRTDFARDATRLDIDVDGAPVAVLDTGHYLVLQRHGFDRYVPAHRIDHVANLRALAQLGCSKVLAVTSVGSLRPALGVGSVIAPHDFIALDQPSISAYDDARCHIVPGFDHDWREVIVTAWNAVADLPVIDGGVYWQANGPRFETPAEIRFVSAFADVIGMTVGSECTIACELGLIYAPVCVVDNLANGLGDAPLTIDEFEAGKEANRTAVLQTLETVLEELAA